MSLLKDRWRPLLAFAGRNGVFLAKKAGILLFGGCQQANEYNIIVAQSFKKGKIL
ncbi:hypothetical protein [Paenibacillus sp. DMB20]|uniref:hypothetical protein n=1 Tax=Paenibacillus sp. DMB20 TaxID=1642570 RepID=UPI000A87015A|nr:hypothetical protein [Paenibacillus sp. DMB20]